MLQFPQSVDRDFVNISTSARKSPIKFFLLTFALSIPFWMLGALISFQPLPGLPVSALMFLCPMMAALILVYAENRIAGVTALLKRSFDYKRIKSKIWYLPIIFLMPGVMVLSYALMRLLDLPLANPHFSALASLALFVAFFIAALGEELGWSGYAIDPMQDRTNALAASIFLGLVWAGLHIIPFVEAGRSPAWIAWQCFGMVVSRVLLVWLYNNTGKSVFATSFFHAMVNVSFFLFPIYGSYYDPRITGLILAFVATIVVALWGPHTLARFGNAWQGRAFSITHVARSKDD